MTAPCTMSCSSQHFLQVSNDVIICNLVDATDLFFFSLTTYCHADKLLLLKMTYVTRRVDSAQYTSRVIPVGTSAEWVVQMSLSTSPLRPKAVYLATNSKLTVIPVDDCGAYANCTDCVGARDPYCAFNMITMTCTSLPSAPSRLMFRQDVVAGNAKSLCPPIRGESVQLVLP